MHPFSRCFVHVISDNILARVLLISVYQARLAREAEKRAAQDAKDAAERERLAAIAAVEAAENDAMAAAEVENAEFAKVWAAEIAAMEQRRREGRENEAMEVEEEWGRHMWEAQAAHLAEQARLEALRQVIVHYSHVDLLEL